MNLDNATDTQIKADQSLKRQITSTCGIFLPLLILAPASLPSSWPFCPPSTASPTCRRALSCLGGDYPNPGN